MPNDHDLGVTLDSTLSFSCYYTLRRMKVIKRSISSFLQPLAMHSSAIALTTAIHCLLDFPSHACPSSSRLWAQQPGSLLVSLSTPTYLPAWLMSYTGFLLPLNPIQGTVLSHQSLTGSSYKIHLRPNVQTCLFCPLQSANQLDLLVLRAKPAIVQHCAFTIVGPSMWNDTPQKSVVSF